MKQGKDLSKTVGYDVLRKDGAKALHKTLLKADKAMIDGDIQRDLDQLMAEMAKGIALGGGKIMETAGLVRLVGYLQELSLVVGMMPAFGFTFREELGKLIVGFEPKRLDPSLGTLPGLERKKG
jgi:hypothetical protein